MNAPLLGRRRSSEDLDNRPHPRSPGSRAVFALLLADADDAVPATTLFEEVWGMAAPAATDEVLTDHIARLRRAVAITIDGSAENPFCGDLVVEEDPTHLVPSLAVDIDLRRRRRLHDAGRRALARGNHALAVEQLGEALEIAPAVPGPSTDDAPGSGDRALEDDRALERAGIERLHAEAQLRLGLHEWALDGVARRDAEDPVHEGPRAENVVALHRAGRHAEALDLYRQACGPAAAEGTAPAGSLRQLRHRLVSDDPGLVEPESQYRPPWADVP